VWRVMCRPRYISRHTPSGGFECRESDGEALGIRMFAGAARLADGCAVEALETLTQHRSVTLVSKAACYVNHPGGINPQKVAVIREVMNRTKGKAVDHRRDSLGRGVRDDVRGLNEIVAPERAHRAPLAVGAQYILPEPLYRIAPPSRSISSSYGLGFPASLWRSSV
jgi:hypothetical protein